MLLFIFTTLLFAVSPTFDCCDVIAVILLVQIALSHPWTIPNRSLGVLNRDLFFTEGGDHVEACIYTLKKSPVCQWATVDQKLFFILNLCEIAHAAIIRTKELFSKKKKTRK